MVSGKRGERLIYMPTQRYDVPSSLIGNRYVGILLVELKGIWNRHLNAERVIVFQTVILQCVSQVPISINIRDHIDSCLDLWNKGAYDKLVQDSHRAAEESSGNKSRNQTQEQRHSNFSNLVLCGKFCKAVRFICDR